MLAWLTTFLTPKTLYRRVGQCLPALTVTTVMLMAIGLIWGFIFAPADYQQQDAFRIIYLHVPAAFLSLGIYTVMALACFMALVFRIKVMDYWAQASLNVGAGFTLIALLTGSIWGKPMWGTWWVWDARLTSELILLFIYIGIILFRDALARANQPQTAAQLFTLIGFVNIPIIHFSVDWWFTLHQGATLSRFAKPAMDASMLWPLLICIAGFACFYLTITAYQLRTILLQSSRHQTWVKEECA